MAQTAAATTTHHPVDGCVQATGSGGTDLGQGWPAEAGCDTGQHQGQGQQRTQANDVKPADHAQPLVLIAADQPQHWDRFRENTTQWGEFM
jgi:hypothetical protein